LPSVDAAPKEPPPDQSPPPPDQAPAACAGLGPPIQLGGAPCTGALAAKLLGRAVCSCSSLVLSHGLYTQGSGGGSRRGPGPGRDALPASVGSDDFLQAMGVLQVAGALDVAGSMGATFSRTSQVLGALRSGGPVVASELLSVGGEAFVAGDLLGRVSVGGALHVPPNASVPPSVMVGRIVREPVAVAPPCDCSAGSSFDIAGVAAAHAGQNDDASIGLTPDQYASATGSVAIDLPCGAYYLSALRVPAGAEVALQVHGRAALFVGGEISAGNGLRVSLDAGAELDLVVAGDLTVRAGLLGGEPAAAVRLWVGGSTVNLGMGAALSGLLYAPAAVLGTDVDLSATGALLAQSFSVGGDLSVRFDPQVLAGGASCGEMPQPPPP
jgi:hypothetical protein